MAEKKKGFFDGLVEAFAETQSNETDDVRHCKEFITNMELSDKERLDLAGWLFGSTLTSQIASALKDEPPTE